MAIVHSRLLNYQFILEFHNYATVKSTIRINEHEQTNLVNGFDYSEQYERRSDYFILFPSQWQACSKPPTKYPNETSSSTRSYSIKCEAISPSRQADNGRPRLARRYHHICEVPTGSRHSPVQPDVFPSENCV